MKNIYKSILRILIVPIVLFGIISCDKDDDSSSSSTPNHRVVYTSEMNFDNTIEVNTDITFGDVSPGVKTRMWTFPEGSANVSSSTEAVVKAIFEQVGEHNVNLHQVFKGNAYVDETLMGTELDTTIVVTVLSQVNATVQAFKLNDDNTIGEELIVADNAENEVTASKKVRFVYTVDGEPQEFEWSFQGGDPEIYDGAEPEVDVKYRSVGTYDMQFIASRARPFGGDTLQFNNLIKVIPSTDPVDLDRVSDKDGKIALEFSRDMDPFTINKDHFSVTIENGMDILNPSISFAEIDSEYGNIVLLTLDNESIYNDDTVKVSYTPGTLMTLDAVAATAFTDEVLMFNLDNILDGTDFDYSFENSTVANWPYLWWGGVWGMYDLDVSSAMAQDGSQSAYIEYHEQGGMIIGHNDIGGTPVNVSFESGQTYEFGIWVYVVEPWFTPGTYPLPGSFQSDVRIYPNNWAFEAIPVTFDENFPVGEWVYRSGFVTAGFSGDVNLFIRGYNEGADERLKFYIDNLIVAPVSLRP